MRLDTLGGNTSAKKTSANLSSARKYFIISALAILTSATTAANAQSAADIMKIYQVESGGSKVLRELQPTDQIATNRISLKAEHASGKVGSMAFYLNNRRVSVENILPYSMFGDSNRRLGAGNLPQGNVTLKVAAYSGKNASGRTLVERTIALNGAAKPATPTTPAPSSGNIPNNAFKATYYKDKNFDFPVLTGTDAKIDFNWRRGSPAKGIPADRFSVIWEGKFNLSGTYEFSATTDDGMQVIVNGKSVISSLKDQSATKHTGKITLNGNTNIQVKYYENTGDAVAKVSWRKLTQTAQPSPKPTPQPKPTPTPTPAPAPTPNPGNSDPVNLGNAGSAYCQPKSGNLGRSATYSKNLNLKAAAYLPGDKGVGMVITAKGAAVAVNTGSTGRIYLVNPATGGISKTITVPSNINDIAYSDAKKELAVATNSSIVVYPIDTLKVKRTIGGKHNRVAIAENGYVAALNGSMLHLYNGSRQTLSKRLDNAVTDVALLSCGGSNNTIFVTSYKNSSFIDLENKRNPVQISKLEALDFNGNRRWKLFDHSNADIKQNVADTRLLRVSVGRDGYVYVAGESAGTATIFRWNGDNPMTRDEQFGKAKRFLTIIDKYNETYNSGAAHISYVGRVDPRSGKLITSQLLMGRLSSNKANAIRAHDVMADSNSTLYFAGTSAASIPNRADLQFNGRKVAGYAGKDPTWLGLAPSFKSRHFWTALTATNGTKGDTVGVAAGFGYAGALSNIDSGRAPVTSGSGFGKVHASFITAR